MFQTKRLRVLLVLIVVVPLFSCGIRATGSKGPEDKTAGLPGWYKNPDSQYPARKYLTATGSGLSSSEAKNDAKAGISERFKQQIESTEEIRTEVRETQGDQSSFLKKVSQQSQITVQTSAELIGVKIDRETSRFIDGETQHFALAVLNKTEAMNNYLREYSQSLDRLRTNYNQAQQSDRPLQKLKYFSRARRAASQAQAYKNIVEVLRTMGVKHTGSAQASTTGSFREQARQFKRDMEANLASDDNQVASESERTVPRGSMKLEPSPAKISRELDKVLNQATVYVQVPGLENAGPVGDFAPVLRSAIEKEFTALDLKTVDEKNQASFLVTPELSSDYTTKGRDSDAAIRWELSIQISELDGDKTFGTITQSDVSVGTDKSMAVTRTRHYVVEWVKENLNDMLVKKLLS